VTWRSAAIVCLRPVSNRSNDTYISPHQTTKQLHRMAKGYGMPKSTLFSTHYARRSKLICWRTRWPMFFYAKDTLIISAYISCNDFPDIPRLCNTAFRFSCAFRPHSGCRRPQSRLKIMLKLKQSLTEKVCEEGHSFARRTTLRVWAYAGVWAEESGMLVVPRETPGAGSFGQPPQNKMAM
jgi:hypothetical protein